MSPKCSLVAVLLLLFAFNNIQYITSGIFSRNGILLMDWNESLILYEKFPSFMHKPFIITNMSKILNWSIASNIKSWKVHKSDKINSKTRFSDCSCFNYYKNDTLNKQICKEFVETHLYTKENKYSFQYWRKFESKPDEINKYVTCTHRIDEDFDNFTVLNELYSNSNSYNNYNHVSLNKLKSINVTKIDNYIHNNNYKISENEFKKILYSSRYISYYFDKKELETQLSNNSKMLQYLRIFGIDKSNNFKSVRMWFSPEIYTTTRHYDNLRNIYLMINGSKTFTISPPTASNRNLFLFLHESDRHEIPYYHLNSRSEHTFTLFENELLYIPLGWFHQVTNSKYSIAMSIWLQRNKANLYHQWKSILKPRFIVEFNEFNEYIYYFQVYPIKWCQKLKENAYFYKYSKCFYNNFNIKEYGFLFDFINKSYPIFNNILMDQLKDKYLNKSWWSLIINTNHLMNDNKIFKSFKEFNENSYICYQIDKEYKTEWDAFIDDKLNKAMEIITAADNKHLIAVLELEYIKEAFYWLSNMLNESELVPLLITMYRL